MGYRAVFTTIDWESKKELVEALNRLYSYEQLDEMQSELLET